MPLTVTQKFHVHNAKQFIESVNEDQNDNYYLFVGRPMAWPNGDDQPAETPTDSVEHSTYEYWRDIMVMRKIRPEDFVHVTRRYDWNPGTRYNMYDHRVSHDVLLANTESPYYVMNRNFDVFKCIYDGRDSTNALPAISADEPSVVGQSDISAVTSSGDYRWKFLYNIPISERLMYLNDDFMPVRSSAAVLETNNTSPSFGDVFDDGTSKYQVFNSSRLFGNGQILQIIVDSPGGTYATAPSVTITGDGQGATAQAFLTGSGTVNRVQIISPGRDYSWAEVTLSAPANTTQTATATAIINPRYVFSNTSGTYYISSHAINLEEELGASYVMLYAELTGTMGGIMTVGNQYRRVGIIRNPLTYGTNTRATNNLYSQMTILTVPSGSAAAFRPDEIVWQSSTNAYGVVVDAEADTIRLVGVGYNGQQFEIGGPIKGIGNGSANGHETSVGSIIPSFPDAFTPQIEASGAVAVINAINYPDLHPFSGDILYVDHRAPVTRGPSQQEVIRTILAF